MDYYEILEINRTATDVDIKKAYRKLAMKWHPDKNPNQLDLAREKFQEIAEAYDVLSDHQKRATFDQYGYEGLREDYQFEDVKRAEDIFKQFFGTENPFFDFGFGDTLPFTSSLNRPEPKKEPPIELKVPLSLEEMYLGTTKSISFPVKRIFSASQPQNSSLTENLMDGDAYDDTNTIQIKIKPGWTHETKITFENEGNEGKQTKLGDVICILEQLPHPSYKRKDDLLIYTAPIKLSEALTDCSVTIPTLDGRKLSIACNEVISNESFKMIENEGMPINGTKERGNLRVEFRIQFPKYLTDFQKKAIKKILT